MYAVINLPNDRSKNLQNYKSNLPLFLISNFCRIMNFVCFLPGNSPTSEFYMPTFWDTLSVPSSQVLMKMEQTECYETSAYKIQAPGNYPKESIQVTVSYKYSKEWLWEPTQYFLQCRRLLITTLYDKVHKSNGNCNF